MAVVQYTFTHKQYTEHKKDYKNLNTAFTSTPHNHNVSEIISIVSPDDIVRSKKS